MKTNRNIHLDLIRGISILCIIFLHFNTAIACIVSNDLILFKYYNYVGSIGVSMFFILSGASLTLSTQNNYSLASFYKKRFLAIFPVFWSTYILVVFADAIFSQSPRFVGRNPLSFLLTITGLDGFLLYLGPNYYVIGEWFLGCIIILYGLFPLARYLFVKNRYLLLFSSLVLCIFLEKIYNFDMLIIRFPPFRIFEFVSGIFIVSVINNLSKKHSFFILIISSIFIWLIFLLNASTSIFVSNAILGVLFFLMIFSASNLGGSRIPVSIISFFSKYSYIAFLVHHVIIIKLLSSAKISMLTQYHKYTVFFAVVFTIYFFSYIFYSLLRKLFRTSIDVL